MNVRPLRALLARMRNRIIAMAIADWRSPAAYEAASRFDAGAFAWEFVRRNPRYRSDFDRYRQGLSSEVADALARRWGLRFCGRPRLPQRRPTGFLVA